MLYSREPGIVFARRARSRIILSLFLFASSLLNLPAAEAPATGAPKTFEVREFGAKGDGKTLDTVAIQKALDECGKSGGGILHFAPGTYLIQPIFLRSKTTLQLDADAKLLATDEPADFALHEKKDFPSPVGKFLALVNATNLTDVAIVGKGTIDGSGARWWGPAEDARRKTPGYTLPRPRLVVFTGCKNVRVAGVTLANSPTFHLVPNNCEDVVIEEVTILAPEHAANTDAIDPSASRRVRISKCLIDVGDDNVAIKSNRSSSGREFACEDITITDCVFRHGHGMSIGSETSGGVRNVFVRNCTFANTENGIRIKSPRGRGGTVENVICENISMTNVDPAITITCYYPKIPKEDAAQPMTHQTPIFRQIRIKNLTATCSRQAGVIIGLPESPVLDVILENVHISAATGLTIRNAKGVQLKNTQVSAREGQPFLLEEAQVEGLPRSSDK
jgi:polygalacturonase